MSGPADTERLRLLVVEDSVDDAERVAREIARVWTGLEWRRVATVEELTDALAERDWDAIIAACTQPHLDWPAALRIAGDAGYDGPFIVVSTASGEESAASAMRAGAHDYVTKDDLRRLVPALERELARARPRAESDTPFRALVESSLDITTILHADGSIRYASRSIEQVLGYPPEEVHGQSAFDLVHPDDAPVLGELFHVAAGVPEAARTGELRARHRDGTWRLMEGVGLNLLADPAVRGMVVTLRDITARRALEQRLSQAERLEAVGQLAGGIAHDLNNILLVIRGYSTVLRSALQEPHQLADVDEIVNAADRAANLTRRLLAFGRRHVHQPRLLSANDAVRSLEPLLRSTISEEIELTFDLRDETPPILADPTQIEQMLLNLLANSSEAITGRGAITVSVTATALETVDESVSPPLLPGAYVTLGISDTGRGISEEALPHVFEPFYTTKQDGVGAGLGLSTVAGIVAKSDGGISIRTLVGEGTTVTIHLPAAVGSAEGDDLPGGPSSTLERGSETILLVEDEGQVRELVQRVLESAGYRVFTAARPTEAEELLNESERIDLLLTDVVMPEMSGFELAVRIREHRPALRTLFISGYAHTAAQAATSIDGDVVLLQKPFSPDQLVRTVRRALDSPQSTVSAR